MNRRETREAPPEKAQSETRSATREVGEPFALGLGTRSALDPRGAAETLAGAGNRAIARAVQASRDGAAAATPEATSPASIHASARHGTRGAGQSLPHLSAIQRSFGPAHDLSSIRAFVGGAAATASAAMGAAAYAYGDRIAFSSAPSLHVAAHEAAHVVQQRRGLSLPGGVGRAGDSYERQADQIAARVVQGRSAAPLLGGSGRASAGTRSVQGSPVVQRLEVGERPFRGGKVAKDGYAPLTRDPLWLERAEAYEKRLGIYAYKHDRAEGALDSALLKLRRVIDSEYKADELDDDARRALYREVFTKDNAGSAGQVGNDLEYDEITDLLANGNLRERMTAFYNAAYYNSGSSQPPLSGLKAIVVDLLLLSEESKEDLETWSSYFSSMFSGADAKKSWPELVAEKRAKAVALGLDADDIENKLKFLHSNWLRYGAKQATSMTSVGYNFADDPFALGNLTLEKEALGTAGIGMSQWGRVPRSAADQTAEKRTAQDYEALGIGLSDREKRYTQAKMGVDDDAYDTTKLPWLEGHTFYAPLDNQWVKYIRDRQRMPVVAGVSGTTTRMLTAFKWLNTGADAVDFRLALLGWMLPAWDHSLYEILRGSHLAGVKGDEDTDLTDVIDMYMNVPPLTTEELRTNVAYLKLFPHEEIYLNNIEHDKSQATGYKAIYGENNYFADATIGDDPNVSMAHAVAIFGYTSGIHKLMNTILSWSFKDPTGVASAREVVRLLKKNASEICRSEYLNRKKALGQPLSDTEQTDLDYLENARLELFDVLKKENKIETWINHCRDISLSYDDVKTYIRTTAYPWISAMRDSLYEELLTHINMTIEGLKDLPKVRGMAYRGDWSAMVGSRYEQGKTVTFNEFSSFSRDPVVARGFAVGGPRSYPFFLTVLLTGKGGRDVSHFSRFPTEAEVLIMPGTKVKITKVTWETTPDGETVKHAIGVEV